MGIVLLEKFFLPLNQPRRLSVPFLVAEGILVIAAVIYLLFYITNYNYTLHYNYNVNYR